MIIGKYYKVTQVVAQWSQWEKVKSYGKCIWIHPARRFCVLRFDTGTMECFSSFDLGVM